MKHKLWYLVLVLILLFSCQNERNLDGNYGICYNGEYAEAYFKKDSMRFASNSEWVKLSEWRKIEIKSDTLHFETFGEWRDSATAKVKFIGSHQIELKILETDINLNLKSFDEKPYFEEPKKFWIGFHTRMNTKKCE
tara:strand:+ start:368 stop:778 length:411 start_codon:yes stop_codon:yes gene_type:complete